MWRRQPLSVQFSTVAGGGRPPAARGRPPDPIDFFPPLPPTQPLIPVLPVLPFSLCNKTKTTAQSQVTKNTNRAAYRESPLSHCYLSRSEIKSIYMRGNIFLQPCHLPLLARVYYCCKDGRHNISLFEA
jgi:hypothetical protein